LLLKRTAGGGELYRVWVSVNSVYDTQLFLFIGLSVLGFSSMTDTEKTYLLFQ